MFDQKLRRTLAISLMAFPVLAIIAFLLHFHSLHGFFNFYWTRPPYHAEGLFNALTSGSHGHGFIIAHVFVYCSVPFLLLTVLVLSWYLLKTSQMAALTGGALGIIGSLSMAGVISSWLSFAAVGHVEPQYYDGARAALIELTNMQGILHANTLLSYLIFVSLIILATGLWIGKQFPPFNMALIILGSLMFIKFMDMDNWMLIATILIFWGLAPVIRRLPGERR